MALSSIAGAGGPVRPLISGLRGIVSAFVDMVEPALPSSSSRRKLVVVEDGEGRLTLHERFKAGAKPVANVAAGKSDAVSRPTARRDVELRLSPDRIIATSFQLPAGAASYLDQIIEHRLERLTPWRPDRVLFGFRTAPRPDGQLDIHFLATSKDIAATVLGKLHDAGLNATAMGSAPLDAPLGVDLFRGGQNTGRSRKRRLIARVAIAVLVAAVALYVGTAWYAATEARRLADIRDAIASARQSLVAGAETGNSAQDRLLLDAKLPDSATFVLLDRLAASIPDDTYLDQLDIGPETVRLVGSSTDASGLLQRIQTNLPLTEAKFDSPVTRQSDGRDRFEVTARRVLGGAAP